MIPLLEIKQLKTYFHKKKQEIRAVDGVSFNIFKGETVALVGESGCGKSLTSISIMGLVPFSGGKVVEGEIRLNGLNLLEQDENEMCRIRGKDISMIFQDPMTSLNPVMKIGKQLTEVIVYHRKLSRQAAHQEAVQLLRMVGFSDPDQMMNDYPHQLSGGMRQRVMIAIAMSCNPQLMIADEPTTALDVTIQAQVLDLMRDLTRQFDTSILLITHDLGVVSELAQRVIVMYAGQIVEESPIDALFDQPLHPYTSKLIESVPRIDGSLNKLNSIPGTVPSAEHWPSGCRFAPRCSLAFDRCFKEQPDLIQAGEDRKVRCFLHEEAKNTSDSTRGEKHE